MNTTREPPPKVVAVLARLRERLIFGSKLRSVQGGSALHPEGARVGRRRNEGVIDLPGEPVRVKIRWRIGPTGDVVPLERWDTAHSRWRAPIGTGEWVTLHRAIVASGVS